MLLARLISWSGEVHACMQMEAAYLLMDDAADTSAWLPSAASEEGCTSWVGPVACCTFPGAGCRMAFSMSSTSSGKPAKTSKMLPSSLSFEPSGTSSSWLLDRLRSTNLDCSDADAGLVATSLACSNGRFYEGRPKGLSDRQGSCARTSIKSNLDGLNPWGLGHQHRVCCSLGPASRRDRLPLVVPHSCRTPLAKHCEGGK